MIGGLRVGELDRLLQFENREESRTASGASVFTWVNAFKAWGKFMADNPRAEGNENNQPVAAQTARILIRQRNGVTETQRIKDLRYDDYWYIKGISRNQREYFVLIVEKKDNV